jgi:hypothetical protein
VTCSIHGHEGDFVEATAFCCTLGHGKYAYGDSYGSGDGYDSYSEPYTQTDQAVTQNQADQQQQLAQTQTQKGGNKARIKRTGHKQTVAKALDDTAAAVSEGSWTDSSTATAIGSTLQQQQATVQAPFTEQQQQPADAADSSTTVYYGDILSQELPTAAPAPAPGGMGGFALRRMKKLVAGVRGAAAVAAVSPAEELEAWQEEQQQQQTVAAIWAPKPKPAAAALYDASRVAALKESLAQAALQV